VKPLSHLLQWGNRLKDVIPLDTLPTRFLMLFVTLFALQSMGMSFYFLNEQEQMLQAHQHQKNELFLELCSAPLKAQTTEGQRFLSRLNLAEKQALKPGSSDARAILQPLPTWQSLQKTELSQSPHYLFWISPTSTTPFLLSANDTGHLGKAEVLTQLSKTLHQQWQGTGLTKESALPEAKTSKHEAWAVRYYPVMTPSHQWLGSWVLARYPAETYEYTNNFLSKAYLLFIFSLFFSGGISILLSRSITLPLRSLIDWMTEVSHHTQEWGNSRKALPYQQAFHPIYEIRKLRESLQLLLGTVRKDYELRDDFIATLTHDLKVPMLGAKQALQYFYNQGYGPLNAGQSQVVLSLLQSVQFVLDLCNCMLEVFRYESGKQFLRVQRLSIEHILRESIEEARLNLVEKQVQIEFDLSGKTVVPLIVADLLELKRVFHNLISNAVQNSPRGSTLHVSIAPPVPVSSPDDASSLLKITDLQLSSLKERPALDDHILVMIRDEGIGISKESMEQLFTRFSSNKSRNPMSFGLGLYNCKQVVEAHGGQIWLESTEGEGTAVILCLPKAVTPQTSHSA
jgi:signal transduction histidine kinase